MKEPIVIRQFPVESDGKTDPLYAPMGRLRFVEREVPAERDMFGKTHTVTVRILQQWWGYCGMYPEWGSNEHAGFWRDVPLETE